MEKRVKKARYFLAYIDTIEKRNQLKKVLAAASDEEIRSLLEVIGNLIEGNLTCRIRDLANLDTHKTLLFKLWEGPGSLRVKRNKLGRSITQIRLVLVAANHFIKELLHH